MRKLEAAAKFVRAFVTPESYEVDTSVSLILDPEDRGYPKTAALRDQLLNRSVVLCLRRSERHWRKGIAVDADFKEGILVQPATASDGCNGLDLQWTVRK